MENGPNLQNPAWPSLLCVQFLTVVELTNGNQKFSRKLQQKNNGRYCGSWAKYCNIMSTPETLQILFISTLSYPRLRSSATGYNYYLLLGGTNLFGTMAGVPVGRHLGSRLATMLVATINNIIFFSFFPCFLRCLLFSQKECLDQKTYLVKVDGCAQ